MHALALLRRPLLALAMLLACALAADAALAASEGGERVPERGAGRVLVAPLTGTVDPVMLEFVTRTLARAKDDGFDAAVFELDTPGGLSTSMDDIVKQIVASDVPVYVFVAPSGARAASAGVFVTYAADVAAMAPATNIGSATPIASNGEQLPKDLRRKVLNDAVARVRELADERGRDAAFGEDAIRDARNVGAREALEIGAVEYVATDVRDLLRQSDGAHVRPKDLTLHLADASLTHVGMPWTLRVLKRITDANLLYLLFGAGIIGLMFELTHPGVLLPGIAGGICLLVALYGMSVLPASGTGIALLVLGAALLAAESVAPGGGVLGAGGAIALVLGAMLLFDDSSGYGVSPALAIGTSVGLVAFFAIVLRKAARARRLPSPTDASFLVGQLATVQRPIAPEQAGSVLVDGELWQARSEVRIAAGERVLVSRVEGLFVDVTQPEEASP